MDEILVATGIGGDVLLVDGHKIAAIDLQELSPPLFGVQEAVFQDGGAGQHRSLVGDNPHAMRF